MSESIKQDVLDKKGLKVSKVSTYFPTRFSVRMCKELLYASHWLDTDTGETVKLTPALKLVYFHRLEQYNSFRSLGCPYIESNQTIAKKLCLDYDMVRRTYSRLLQRMGLLFSEGSVRKRVYTVNPVGTVKGELINYTLNEVVKPFEKKSDESFTYENLKNLEFNKEGANRMRQKSDQKYHVISDEDLKRILNRKEDK